MWITRIRAARSQNSQIRNPKPPFSAKTVLVSASFESGRVQAFDHIAQKPCSADANFATLHLCLRSTKNRPAATVTFKTTRRTRAKDIIPRIWPNTDASGATIEVHGLLCTSPEALFVQTAEELSLEDLIEFGDSLVCRDPARRRTTLAELRKFIHPCDSFQGQNNASGHSPRFARTPTPRPRPTCACCSNGMDSPSQSSTSRSRLRAMPRTVPQFRTACDRPNPASLSLGSCAATAHCAVA